MAKAERDAAKEFFWPEALAVPAASILSGSVYSQREGLSQSSLYAWRRRISERDGESPKAPSFVPVVGPRWAPRPPAQNQWAALAV